MLPSSYGLSSRVVVGTSCLCALQTWFAWLCEELKLDGLVHSRPAILKGHGYESRFLNGCIAELCGCAVSPVVEVADTVEVAEGVEGTEPGEAMPNDSS
jgi:hypothetical protein